MRSRPGAGAAVALATLFASSPLGAHPGPRDEHGCHICRTKCKEYGLTTGMRHCHDGKPEQAVPAAPRGEVTSTAVYVERILDGDTLEVKLGGEKQSVRILGMDCPESKRNHKCQTDVDGCAWQLPWGLKAAERAAQLLKHQSAKLECVGKCEVDVFNRPLRYVRLADGRDFGLVMIQEGLCADYGWKYSHPRGDEYAKAQEEPKKAKKGMWQEDRWDR